MPLYEYKCNSCGAVFEVIQRFSDAPLTVHEGCGGDVERLLSAPAFQFKGTGWYITDYARGKNGGGSTTHKESKTETKSDTATKTETKTDTSSKSSSTPATATK